MLLSNETTISKNVEIIKQLEVKIETLEKEKTLTSGASLIFKCEECDYEAKDRLELSWHLNENHGWPLDRSIKDLDMTNGGVRFCSKCDYQAEDGYHMDGHKWSEHDDDDLESLRCNFCDKSFSFLRELMYHKKDDHGCTWKEHYEQAEIPATGNTDTYIIFHNKR